MEDHRGTNRGRTTPATWQKVPDVLRKRMQADTPSSAESSQTIHATGTVRTHAIPALRKRSLREDCLPRYHGTSQMRSADVVRGRMRRGARTNVREFRKRLADHGPQDREIIN